MEKYLNLPGNKLLHEVWSGTNWNEPKSDRTKSNLPEIHKPVYKSKDWKSSIDDDFFPDLEDEDCVGARKRISDTIAQSGIHALAWYQHYRFENGRNWGIFFDVIAMDLAAQNLFLEAHRINSKINFSQVLNCLYDMVLRHEVEHLVQELLITMYSDLKDAKWMIMKQVASVRDSLEIAATHMELFDTYNSGSRTRGGEREIIRMVWSMTPFPLPYSLWVQSDIKSMDGKLLKYFNIENTEALSNIRKLTGRRGNNKWIKVPIYYFESTQGLSTISPHSFRKLVNCKQLLSWFKNPRNKEICGHAFQFLPGGKEPYKLKIDGGTRPIPFTCHNKKEAETYIFRQIASQIHVPYQTVFRFIASNL